MATGISVNDIRARVQDMYPRHIPIRGFPGAIKNVVQHIHQFGKWSFNFKQGIFSTVADYSTGTLVVTNASATVLGVGTTFDSAHAGRKIRISGVEYEISTRESTTEVTLTQNYAGATDSGLSYVIYQDEYDLASDVKTIYRMWDIQNEHELKAASQLDLRSRTLRQGSGGNLQEYAAIGLGVSDVLRILVRPYPEEIVQVEYWYEAGITEVSAVTSTVDLPGTMDECVVQGVYARIMQFNQQVYSIQERQLAHRHFRDLLKEQWKTDKPLRDRSIRMGRRDGSTSNIQIVADPRPTRISAT